MNTSVKVVLYLSKKLSSGEYPIMLRIIKDRKPKYISTGASCSKELWDTKLNIPKKSHPLFKELRILIGKKKLDAEKFVLNLENENKDMSSYEIKGKMRKAKVNNPQVFAYFDEVIARMVQSGQIKNSEVYKDTKRNLSYFTGTKDIHFSDIDVAFLNKFQEYLKEGGKGGNTIYIYLCTLRALLNKAIKKEVCNEKYYPFRNFSLAKYANIKTAKRAIRKEEMAKIKKIKLSEPIQLLARDIFLFSFYCRGMNFTDIAFLKWKNIKNKRMIYTRQKTKELFNLELLPPALKILAFYEAITHDSPENYVFPILQDHHMSPTIIYNRKVKILRMINKNLKTIGNLCGIQIELTTYVARHSYATILKNNGIPTALISRALGHDSEKTTQIYLDDVQDVALDEASKKIL